MSRTKRNLKHINSCALRNPKTQSIRIRELAAVEEIKDAGFIPKNRLVVRGNPGSKVIPTAWDDIVVAAWYEQDFKVN